MPIIVVAYVDDLILVGMDLAPGLLEAIRREIKMEDPAPLHKYLGCKHEYKKTGELTTMTWKVGEYLKSSCDHFEEVAGIKLNPAATPYATEIPRDRMDENLNSPGKWGSMSASLLMRLMFPARSDAQNGVLKPTGGCRESMSTAVMHHPGA